MNTISGQCLCGSVAFSIDTPSEVEACHCGSCRRWGCGPFVGVEAESVAFESDDTLSWFQSSDWASRGFCSKCGSTLFYKLADAFGGGWTVTAGAFDDLPTGLPFAKEIFIEEKPDYYNFAGDRPRMTGEEVFAAAQSEQPS